MFLIIGHPRSATLYIANTLRHLGYDVGHESGQGYEPAGRPRHWSTGKDGNVSYLFRTHDRDDVRILYHVKEYGHVVHQVRHPLKVISSMKIEGLKIFHNMIDVIGYPRPWEMKGNFYLNLHWWAMYTWYHWNLFCGKHASWTYRIEEIDAAFPELLSRLGLGLRGQALPRVDRKTNTRSNDLKRSAGYHLVGWQRLEQIDPELTKRCRDLAAQYGYEEEP